MFGRETLKKTEIKLPADLKYSKLVRDFAGEYLTQIGVPQDEINRLILVLDELWMNAVRYGSDVGSFAKVSFQNDAEGLEMTVEDEGVGRKRIRAKELRNLIQSNIENMKHDQTCGRGIALIANKWTDGLEIEESRMGGIKISVYRKSANYVDKSRPLVEEKHEMGRPEKKNIDYVGLPIRKVKMSGHITQENLPEYTERMQELIENGGASLIILDFEKLDYINSLFVGALAGWAQSESQHGGDLIVVNMQKGVRDVIELCGLWQIISFYDTIDAVKADLNINL